MCITAIHVFKVVDFDCVYKLYTLLMSGRGLTYGVLVTWQLDCVYKLYTFILSTISYTRFLYNGSRLTVAVARLCILIYTLSVLLSYYSVYTKAIISHSGFCDSER